MLFSKTVTHGVYILCHLSKQEAKSVVTASAVAEAMGVPPEQTAKILQVLAGAGMVVSVRGRCGGYRLEKDPGEISLAEVMDALGPDEGESSLGPRACPLESGQMCGAHSGLLEVQARVRELLATMTLGPVLAATCAPETQPEGPETSVPDQVSSVREVPER